MIHQVLPGTHTRLFGTVTENDPVPFVVWAHDPVVDQYDGELSIYDENEIDRAIRYSTKHSEFYMTLPLYIRTAEPEDPTTADVPVEYAMLIRGERARDVKARVRALEQNTCGPLEWTWQRFIRYETGPTPGIHFRVCIEWIGFDCGHRVARARLPLDATRLHTDGGTAEELSDDEVVSGVCRRVPRELPGMIAPTVQMLVEAVDANINPDDESLFRPGAGSTRVKFTKEAWKRGRQLEKSIHTASDRLNTEIENNILSVFEAIRFAEDYKDTLQGGPSFSAILQGLPR